MGLSGSHSWGPVPEKPTDMSYEIQRFGCRAGFALEFQTLLKEHDLPSLKLT